MKDFTTEDSGNERTEDSEKADDPTATLEEARSAIMNAHDTLDAVKEAAKTVGGDLENLIGDLDGDQKNECQQLIHSSVLLYERVDRGDHQIVRGL